MSSNFGLRVTTIHALAANPRRVPRKEVRRHALRAWPEIARALHGRNFHALFLDFDGTLVAIRKRPEKVRCPLRVRHLLARLVKLPNCWVGIVSGRRAALLARIIGVPGIHYRGVYGAESAGSPLRLPGAARRRLGSVRAALARQLKSIRGVWMENKGLSFVVHYRGARGPMVKAAQLALRRALGPVARFLRIIAGRQTWEVVPRQIPGKGATVSAVMHSLPRGAVPTYIGDDAADESAFAALPRGITIRVGPRARTRARYFLRNPAEVHHWLRRFEEAVK